MAQMKAARTAAGWAVMMAARKVVDSDAELAALSAGATAVVSVAETVETSADGWAAY